MKWVISLKTILVVDDEESDREIIRRILKGEGYTVVEAESYEEAFSVFEQNRYSIALVVLDISLPGGNGCELAIALKSKISDFRVLFVSGHVGAEICKYYGLQVSDEHFLRKPFEVTELLAKVLQIMSSEASFPKFCDTPPVKTRTAE
jgi:DNA-binding response OmpR family regulator